MTENNIINTEKKNIKKCLYCGKIFTNPAKTIQNWHIDQCRKMHSQKCPFCNEITKFDKKIRKHIRSSQIEHQWLIFECDKCNKKHKRWSDTFDLIKSKDHGAEYIEQGEVSES